MITALAFQFHFYLPSLGLFSIVSFIQEKALGGAISVIVKTDGSFAALVCKSWIGAHLRGRHQATGDPAPHQSPSHLARSDDAYPGPRHRYTFLLSLGVRI